MSNARVIEPKEIEEIAYREALDVVLLFREDRLFHTLFNAMAHINNACLKWEQRDADSIPMIIHAGVYEAFNVEYNLFIEALSLNFDERGARDFIMDFALSAGKTRGRGAMCPLLLNTIMENIRLVSVNSELAIRRAYYKPIVYQHTGSGNAVQMAALTFRQEALYRTLGNGEGVAELIESLEYFADKAFECEQKAFGVSDCRAFWQKRKKPVVTMMKLH